MRYRCSACNEEFEAEEGRCPRCLRQSTVRPAGEAGRAATRDTGSEPAGEHPQRSLEIFGLIVAIAVITPFMVMNHVRWRLGWWFTFVVALVGFGLGHLVSYYAQSRKR